MELNEIELEQKKLRDICVFGHIDLSCPYISIERMEYCVSGRCKECEHYRNQLAKKLEQSNS